MKKACIVLAIFALSTIVESVNDVAIDKTISKNIITHGDVITVNLHSMNILLHLY